MFVQRGNGERVWVKAAADGNGNLPLRSWPAWEEGPPPAVAASLASLDGPQVAFTYPSAASMLIEVAVPVEGVIEHSLVQGELQSPELSVIDPHIAGSASDPSIFTANRPSTPFVMVVFQKRIDLAFLQTVERKTGMWPLLFSPDGRYRQQLEPLNLSLQELLPNLADASAGIKAQTVSTGQGSFYAAALPWQFEQQPGFVLALVASQNSTLQNIRQTVEAILTVTSLILALSLSIGIFWLGRFIDPIIALTNAVKAIGQGSRLERGKQSEYLLTAENLHPLAIDAPGEIGDLAWAFDVMIGELHYSFDLLEQRVQDRTAELRSLYQMLEQQNLQLEEQSSELSASNHSLQEEINERSLIEDLLRLREQEFRSLAENSPDNIARYDRECRIKYWNSKLQATLGSSINAIAGAYIGKKTTELFPDGRFDGYQEAIENVIESGLEAEIELVLPDAGNGVHYHLVRMVAERDQSGEVTGVLAIGRDITERKAFEKQLALLDYALDHVKDTVWLIGEDAHFYHVNKESCRTLGYGYDEMLGLGVPNIDPDYQQDRWFDHWRDLKVNGSLTFETGHRTKDGRIFPVEINANYFEFDGQGYNLALARDITERKRIEETLNFIAQSSWKEGAESFLTALARYLGKMLDVDYVIVDKLAEVAGHAETVALYAKGEVLPNMQYSLRGTPCENVMEGELCCYATDVQQQFPEDTLLVDMQVESYSGIPLWDSNGKVLGLIAVMDGKPIEDKAAVTSILQLVATRAAAELEREQSERALAESRQFLNQVIDTIPYPVFVKDREHRWILLNQEFCDFIGHPMEGLLAQSDYDFFPVQEADVFWAQDEVVFNSGKEDVNEEEFTDRQGSTHNILTKKICYADNQGRQYLVGIILDITERKQYELNLLKRVRLEEQLSGLAASVPGFMFTIRVAADGHASFPFASAGIEQLFGLRPEDIRDDAAVLRARYHPDDLPRILVHMDETQRTLAPFRIEIRILHPDNGMRWVEIRSLPQRHQDGSIEWHGLMIDITERKQAEAEKQRLINIMEQSIDFIGSADMQGRMLYHNRAALSIMGFPEDADLSMAHFTDMLPAWALKLIQETAMPALYKHGVWRGESAILHRAGREIPVYQLLIGDVIARVDTHLKLSLMQKQLQAQNLQLQQHRQELERQVAERTAELSDSNRSLEAEIRERQRAEAALQESERQYRSLVEHTPDAIARYDRNCQHLYANPKMIEKLGGETDNQLYAERVSRQ
jgi:PAS domain S-box-containing protein